MIALFLHVDVVNLAADSAATLLLCMGVLVQNLGANTNTLARHIVLELMLALASGLQGLTHFALLELVVKAKGSR